MVNEPDGHRLYRDTHETERVRVPAADSVVLVRSWGVVGEFRMVVRFVCVIRVCLCAPVRVPCVSRLSPVSFYRYKNTGGSRHAAQDGHTAA